MGNEIRVENVNYNYRNNKKNVLNNVSCTFKQGEVTAVVGVSGSGKTTLLSIIGGLDKPSEGEIYFDEEPYSSLDLDYLRREKISMIFQNYNLLPFCTALENVSYPMELLGYDKKEAEEQAKEYLTLVGIDSSKYQRFPSKLSGGEQQRVAMARALSSGAQVLLADEPTGNLDEQNKENMIEVFKSLAHQKGYCVIIVTHDLTVADASDKVYNMKNGLLSI